MLRRPDGIDGCLNRIAACDQDVRAWVEVAPQPPLGEGLLRLLMGRYWFHYKPIEHLYYFGPGTLSALLTETGFRVLSYGLSGKIVTFRYLCARLRAYSPLASRLLLATFTRTSLASRPFFLPIGEFVIFAERC